MNSLYQITTSIFEHISLKSLVIEVFICFLLIFLAAYIVRLRGRELSKRKMLLYFLFLLNLCVLVEITVLGRVPNEKYVIRDFLDFGNMESWLGRRQILYSMLNVALFVPYGIIVYLLRDDNSILRRIIFTVLISFIMSSAIEITQHITNRGYLELTDLVTNVLGGLIGAVIVWLVQLMMRNEK